MALAAAGLPARLKSSAVAVQGCLGVLFLGYTVFASNPLMRLADPPVEGRSLNPLLQDPYLAIHPPFLYAGYVGMSVVFSLALATLIEGRVDAAWARWVRPWGGWWAWDPVENASFMPWLAATALLHSATVTEKRGALAGWTVFLGLVAFTFSMLGAFLVRSGVLTSVHAFAIDAARGILLLIILGVAAGAGFAVFAWRAPGLSPGGLFAPISREGALVLNNLFIAAATAAVLFGTLFPLIRQALSGDAVSVGAPYFNRTFAPIMAAALVILPIAPLMPWKRADLKGAMQRLGVAAGLAVATAIASFVLARPGQAITAAGLALGVWLIAGTLTELAQRARGGGARAGEVWRRLLQLPRGAWGMTLAHIGLGLFIIGATMESSGRIEAAKVLGLGDSMGVAGYQMALSKVGDVDGANYTAQRATLAVTRNGAPVCQAAPERRFYPASQQTTSRVTICVRGLSDLYLVLGEPRTGAGGQPTWLIRAYWNPWVRLIFLGPLLMAFGGGVSLSDRRLRFGLPRRAVAAATAVPEPAE
jgi:cytochrome c-type biogenesis protein CcmF